MMSGTYMRKAKKPIAVYVVDPKADLVKVHGKLTKDLGETQLVGQGLLDAPPWQWPAR